MEGLIPLLNWTLSNSPLGFAYYHQTWVVDWEIRSVPTIIWFPIISVLTSNKLLIKLEIHCVLRKYCSTLLAVVTTCIEHWYTMETWSHDGDTVPVVSRGNCLTARHGLWVKSLLLWERISRSQCILSMLEGTAWKEELPTLMSLGELALNMGGDHSASQCHRLPGWPTAFHNRSHSLTHSQV